MGIGAIPLWTTGFAHVEQQSWKKNAPLSFGLINGASATGKQAQSRLKAAHYQPKCSIKNISYNSVLYSKPYFLAIKFL